MSTHFYCQTKLVVLVLTALSACAAPVTPAETDSRLPVVASILPLADFARQVGRDRVRVETLVPPGASPHTYELTPAQLRSVKDACWC
jgi:ABC-type Zn uptake system ZnuABC Zn-binding protein ZnuA